MTDTITEPVSNGAPAIATFDQLLNRARAEATFEVLLDPALAEPLNEAVNRVEELKTDIRVYGSERLNDNDDAVERLESAKDQLEGAEQRLAEVRAEARASTVVLKLREIGRQHYNRLVAAAPPEAKDKKEGGVWNPDKFVPALLAAVVVEPVLSVHEAKQIYDTWPSGEISALFSTCIALCTGRKVVDLGKDSSGMESSRPTSSSPTSTESHSASSSDEVGQDQASPSG